MGRFLALDYGTKRIGIAISDPLNLTAQPLPFLNGESMKSWTADLRSLVDRYEVEKIFVGLPKSLRGTDTQSTQAARTFAKKVEELGLCPVEFRDERLSTVAVNKYMIESDLSRDKRQGIRDSHSAAFFLQGFLDSL